MIEDGLVALLKTFDAVTAIVGSGDDARIRPDRPHEDDPDDQPGILVAIEAEEAQNDLEGETGLVKATVVLTSYDREKADARALAEAIRRNGTNPGTGLSGYSGNAGSEGHIDAWWIRNDLEFVQLEEGSDEGWYLVHSEYSVWFTQTA